MYRLPKLLIFSIIVVVTVCEEVGESCMVVKCQCIPMMEPPSVGCGYMKLSRIPSDFPAYAEVIHFMGNSVTALNRTHTFPGHLANVTSIMMYDGFVTLERVGTDSFVSLTTLLTLDLHGNSIRTLETHAFRGLRALRDLLLYDNALVTLAVGSMAGVGVLNLDLSRNRITAFEDAAFATSSVRHLGLDSNSMERLRRAYFSDLRDSLRSVSVSDNGVDLEVDSYAFSDLRLDSLIMRNSRLTDGGFTDSCWVTGSLDLSENLQPTFNLSSLTNLTSLRLARISLASLTLLPEPNSVLEHLDLSGNELRNTGSSGSSGPKFSMSQVYGYINLVELTLSQNNLRTIPAFDNTELLSLKVLNLDGNKITDLPYSILTDYISNHSMQTINLMGNSIQTLPHTIEGYLKQVNVILAANPLHCNCEIEWFRKWAIVYASSVDMNYQCESPAEKKAYCRVVTNWPSCEFTCRPPQIVDFLTVEVPQDGFYLRVRASGDPAPVVHLIDLADPGDVVEVYPNRDKSVQRVELTINLRGGGVYRATATSVVGVVNNTRCFTVNGTSCDGRNGEGGEFTSTPQGSTVTDLETDSTDTDTEPTTQEYTTYEQTIDGQTTYNRTTGDQTTIEQTTDEKITGDQTTDKQTTDDQTTDKQTTYEGNSTGTESVPLQSTDAVIQTTTIVTPPTRSYPPLKTTALPIGAGGGNGGGDRVRLALIVAGVILLAAGVIAAVVCCYRKRVGRHKSIEKYSTGEMHVNRAFELPQDIAVNRTPSITSHSPSVNSLRKAGLELTPAVSTDMIIGTDFLDGLTDISSAMRGDDPVIRPLAESDREKQKFTDLSKISDISDAEGGDVDSEKSYNRASTLNVRHPNVDTEDARSDEGLDDLQLNALDSEPPLDKNNIPSQHQRVIDRYDDEPNLSRVPDVGHTIPLEDETPIRNISEDKEKNNSEDVVDNTYLDNLDESISKDIASIRSEDLINSGSEPDDLEIEKEIRYEEDNHSCASSLPSQHSLASQHSGEVSPHSTHSTHSTNNDEDDDVMTITTAAVRRAYDANSQSNLSELSDNEAEVLKAFDDALLSHTDDADDIDDTVPFRSDGFKWGEHRSFQ